MRANARIVPAAVGHAGQPGERAPAAGGSRRGARGRLGRVGVAAARVVASLAAVQLVLLRVGGHGVAAAATADDVRVVVPHVDRVVVRAAVDAVAAGAAVAPDGVVAGAAVDRVRAIVAGERVAPAPAAHDVDRVLDVVVLAGLAVVGLVVEAHVHRIRAARVVRRVDARTTRHRVRAGAAVEHVVARPALKVVRL